MKLNIKKNDRVKVIAGREKGKIGRVIRVIPEKGRIMVEKTNMVKRHMRPTKAGQSGILEKEAPLNISNVMLICGKCNNPVRVRHEKLEDGRHMRICKKCGEHFDQ